jgi:hypothetical protein
MEMTATATATVAVRTMISTPKWMALPNSLAIVAVRGGRR